MTEHLYLLTICLPLGVVLLVFAMRTFAATRQAQARLAQEAGYRHIAEQGLATHAAIQAALADMAARLAGIEKILRDVG